MDSELKKQLDYQAGDMVKMSDELFERFIGSMTGFTLKNKEVLIPYGKLDTNLYVQKTGILRACYFDEGNEKTYGFSNPGTIVISFHSHFVRRPSIFQIESCGESEMLKMTKRELDELLLESHEFARWMLAVHFGQLYINEFKHAQITGQAKERYLFLLENRPEIIERVPVKTLASYLGVTPNYLSRLKSEAQQQQKKK